MDKNNNKNKRFCYVVMCNPEPIVYGVYSNKKSALEYTQYLIKYRQDRAKERNWEFGFYHKIESEEFEKSKSPFDEEEKTIFSACLKIKGNIKEKECTDDGCFVQVKRLILCK